MLIIINTENTNYGIYHFSNEGEATWYDFTKEIIQNLNLPEAQLPWRRRVPSRFTIGDSEPEYHTTPEQYFRQIYYEALALDLIINRSKDRFDQPGYSIYSNLEELILKQPREKSTNVNWNVFSLFMEQILHPCWRHNFKV